MKRELNELQTVPVMRRNKTEPLSNIKMKSNKEKAVPQWAEYQENVTENGEFSQPIINF